MAQMLPFGGQGANSAIEDGGSLGYLFQNVDGSESTSERLELFQKARQARAARVQILSSVRAGKEKEVEQQLQRFSDPPGSSEQIRQKTRTENWRVAGVPTNMVERTAHDYG